MNASSASSTVELDDDVSQRLTWQDVAMEEDIAAILDRPLIGEPAELGFERKERELRAVFAALSVQDARELHRRFTLALAGDALSARFQRLIVARRGRLLTFLADARRRAAICGTR